MWRTKRGRGFLKKLAEKKRFWKSFGNFGIVLCIFAMILMTAMLIWQAWFVFGFTPEQKEALPGPEIALILPGINPILPIEYVGYIILAFIVAIIVHEFSHGILTIASKLKVKSLGILYLIFPIGAFCEPDENGLKKAKTKPRMRIYAAGPTANFVVVLVSILLFSFAFMSSIQPAAEGAHVFSVDQDSPAEKIGLQPGMTITSFNNTKVTNVTEYFYVLRKTNANQTTTIRYKRGDKELNATVTLTDRYLEHEKRGYLNNESFKNMGYLGTFLLRDEVFNNYLSALKNPFKRFPDSFLLFFVIPILGYFQGYNPIVSPFTDSYVITGPLSVIPINVFWIIVNALYWIFWLNLAVALFNVLPMVPLDGGFLFNDAMGSFIKRIKKGISDEKREKLVKNISLTISLTILLLIMFPWLIKYL
ncbi:MAG: site-2 protease family protein [Thermoplasmatales archaeon]|nr:MAG: site-2 protease family protein [Thermoplasmatales archaeon]